MKQIIGITLQDKYGLGGTKLSDYVYDKDGGGSLLDLEVVVDAIDEEAAIKKAEPKIEKLRDSSLGRKMGADEVMDGMEDAVPTNEPLSHTDISTNRSV